MLKKIILIVGLFCILCSCTSLKKIREKDRPNKLDSIAVISLFSEGIHGGGYKYFSSHQSEDFAKDWGVNNHNEVAVRNLLDQRGLKTTAVNYDRSFVGGTDYFLKSVELKNKNLPDFYLILLGENPQDGAIHDDNYGSGGILALPILAIHLASIGIHHNYIKYSTLEIPRDMIYLAAAQKNRPNIKVVSFGGSLNKGSFCNAAFKLFLIDRKKRQLIAFVKNDLIKKLPKYYEWEKFENLSNFSSEDRGEIKERCLANLSEAIKSDLVQIGLIE
jgi:hypothetical protein